MWLKLENGHELDNPSARDIEQALSTLGENAEQPWCAWWRSSENSFAILSQSDLEYMQTYTNRAAVFVLG